MSEENWLAESVVQFARSPLWRSPVDNFVDDNCWLFDDGEMRVEQTEVHLKFRALIDDLLTSFVQDIGVPLEQVIESMQNTVNSNSPTQKPAESFLSNIFYVDDFRSFHKMMAKRNIELDILATRALQRRGQLKSNDDAPPLSAAEECDMNEDEALRLAIAASLKEDAVLRQEMHLEDVQIQEALALSIAAEEERARRATDLVEAEAAQNPTAEATTRAKLTALEEEKAQNIMKLEARALEVRQEVMLRALSSTQVVESKGTPTAAAVKTTTTATTTATKAATTTATSSIAPIAAPTMPFAPPRPGPGKGFGMKALPSIQPSFTQLEAMTTKSLAKGPPATATTAPTPAPTQPSGPTLEEMEARAKYMREQREKIVAQNKAKREMELKEYTANGAPKEKSSGLQDGEKQMTVDLARRLREDILHEATK